MLSEQSFSVQYKSRREAELAIVRGTKTTQLPDLKLSWIQPTDAVAMDVGK